MRNIISNVSLPGVLRDFLAMPAEARENSVLNDPTGALTLMIRYCRLHPRAVALDVFAGSADDDTELGRVADFFRREIFRDEKNVADVCASIDAMFTALERVTVENIPAEKLNFYKL